MDYVESVLASSVTVHCESGVLRGKFGLASDTGTSVTLLYADKAELASVLTALQELGIPFISAGPNPPSDVFEFLRSEGLVTGRVRGIRWRGPGDAIIDDA
jgi:hypothetical protein